MIKINYGDAIIKVKSTMLNESLAHEMEVAELSELAFGEDGKSKSPVALVKLLNARYNYFANRVESVEGLINSETGEVITLEDVKALRLPTNMLTRLIDAHKVAQNLELESQEADPKKN